ncbi:MAG: TolC family protein [Planctomycetaceae bacterium]
MFCLLAGGCSTAEKSLTYIGQSELRDYQDHEMRLERPVEEVRYSDPALATLRPHTISDRGHDEIWDLTLAEAIHLALINNRLARTRNDFLSPGNSVLNNPDGILSVYDPAIRDTGVLFGARGVESALAAFDTQWSTSMQWGSNSAFQNNSFLAGGLPEGAVLNQDTAQFSTGLTKNLAYGATVGISHNWNYLLTNQPFQLFPSFYSGNIQLNYLQPLWAGAGAEVTRIAGPFNTNINGVSGVNQGVIVSRINTDMSLVDFEAQVRNMIKDVEDVYWELYLAYRTYDSLVVARNTALATWRVVSRKMKVGLPGGGSAEEAEALEAYYDAQARVQTALGGPAARAEPGVYGLELQLRRLLRLPANDGRIIRPADEPAVAELAPDWHVCLAEAVTRREEIRRQKWNVKSLELQLAAAENYAHPQLNFLSTYQINGMGNDLFASHRDEGTRRGELASAYRTLFQANQTGWTLGLQFTMPLGLRNALAQVRNIELRLTKAREVLAAQEIEVSHELANAFQLLDYWYTVLKTNYNRLDAAERRLTGVQAEYDADRKPLDFLLQAQARRANAEASYFRALTEYNKAICEIHYRKGTLLENNSIHLAEATWTPEAYKDAIRRAWARTFAFDAPEIDPLRHEPEAFVYPPQPPVYMPEAGEPMSGYEAAPPLLPSEPAPPYPAPSNGIPEAAPGIFDFSEIHRRTRTLLGSRKFLSSGYETTDEKPPTGVEATADASKPMHDE